MDKLYRDYITNHTEKIHLNLTKCCFKLAFNNFIPLIKNEFLYNTKFIHLKGYLLHWIENFILEGYNFFDTSEMKIKTISDKKYFLSSI